MNLAQEAAALTEFWAPKVLGQVNDQFVKVAKVKGELVWHKHDAEDELFLVLAGRLQIDVEATSTSEAKTITLEAGDFYVVPRGVMHNPHCDEECLIALFEPVTTQHTGDINTDKTKSIAAQLA